MSDVRNPQQFYHGSMRHIFEPGQVLHGGVYLTTKPKEARAWAEGGKVYEMSPIGDIEKDPEDDASLEVTSFKARSAKVLREL